MTELWTRRTGPADGVPLVLLHGLGATAEVFAPLAELAADRWPGPCVVVDLPGHGRSPRLPSYAFAEVAAAVAAAVPEVTGGVVLGHSYGGVVALLLAGGGGPRGVVATSVKARWTTDELARVHALAARPARRFATQGEAADRFVAVAGLAGTGGSSDLRGSGVRRDGDAWVLAQDPATNAVDPPELAALLAAARCPVVVATGVADPMAPPEHLPAGGVVVDGAGHNAHVDRPDRLLDLAREVADL